MSEFWEPWQPKYGDQVRVKLSAECNRIHPSEWPDAYVSDGARCLIPERGHLPQEDGATGMIIMYKGQPRIPDAIDGHCFIVEFNPSVNVDKYLLTWDCFAVAELEPLTVEFSDFDRLTGDA